MTKAEALEKIKELENYIKELDNSIGFEDDEIFLLSIEEYEKYKDEIPLINTWWWLRSSDYSDNTVPNICYEGLISNRRHSVNCLNGGVRHAIKYSNLNIKKSNLTDNRFIWNDFPFIIIDEKNKIAIAEVPITFDEFDYKSNNYKDSYIRDWLLDWYDRY